MSIFTTNANTSLNSFSNPQNAVNQNPGQVGINPNYLTPNYDAPYRPPYSGQNSSMQHPNPGFARSAFGLSPFSAGTPYGVGSQQQDSRYFDQLSQRPSDAFMALGQRIATPMTAYAIAAATVGGASGWAGNAGASALSSGMRGLIGGVGGSPYGMLGKGAISAAGLVGRGIGWFGGAAVIAGGAMHMADTFVFDQYTSIRENQNMLRSQFSGVNFGGTGGNSWSGSGLSRRSAANIGTQLTNMGNRDQNFNSREITSLTSMASNMGLMDNVGSDQIVGRMQSLVKQLKLVMSVTGSTDFKETMQMMGRMHAGGVSAGNVSSFMGGIGAMSSIAGISANKMVNTVGAQGEYMFRANGLTPYVGQQTAGQAMALMASGFRVGQISSAAMARMGGVEGGTQLAVQGQLNAAQSTYNSIKAFNQYGSGMGGNGVMQNLTNFAQAAASDPVHTMGGMILAKSAMISEQLKDQGPMVLDNLVRDIAKMRPGMMKGGKVSAQSAAVIMQGDLGMTESEIGAHMGMLSSARAGQGQRRAAMKAFELDQQRDFLEQTGQTLISSKFSPVSKAARGAVAAAGSMWGSLIGTKGGITDHLDKWWTEATVGNQSEIGSQRPSDLATMSSLGNRMLDVSDPSKFGRQSGFQFSTLGGGGASGRGANRGADLSLYKKINQLALEDPQMAKALISDDHGTVTSKISNASKKGLLDPKYKDATAAGDFARELLAAKRTKGQDTATAQFADYDKRLGDIGSNLLKSELGTLDRAEMLEAANRITTNKATNGDVLVMDEQTKKDMELLARGSKSGISKTNEPAIGELATSLSTQGLNSRVNTEDQITKLGGAANIRSRAQNRPDDIFSNSEAGKGFRKEYNEAVKSKKDVQSILVNAIAENTDSSLKAAGSKYQNDNVDPATRLAQQNKFNEGRRVNRQLDDAVQNGVISSEGYFMQKAGLAMKDAVAEFGDHVKAFGAAAGGKPVAATTDNRPKGASGFPEGTLLNWANNKIYGPKS